MSETVDVFRAPQPHIRRVAVDRPWTWLAAGWRDLWAAPARSLAYGRCRCLQDGWRLPCCCGPTCPISCCRSAPASSSSAPSSPSASTRSAAGARLPCPSMAVRHWRAWRRNPDQIALMGVLLLLFHLAWMRAAQLLFALFEWRPCRRGTASWTSSGTPRAACRSSAFGVALRRRAGGRGLRHRRLLDAVSARPARRQPVRGDRHLGHRRAGSTSGRWRCGRR